MREVPSPQGYIDFGFYYLISAALQRRVWTGPSHMKLFPNVYVIFVGEPGIGKGRVLTVVNDLLRHFKLENPNKPPTSAPDPSVVTVEPAMIEAINHANFASATGKYQDNPVKNIFDTPLLLPVAADASTFEALLKAMARATRRINYKEYDNVIDKQVIRIYTHSSLCFCLEEISSLFRDQRATTSVTNFFLKAYDCGDYEYDTKTQGRDLIRRCCLNFLGGTTPDFMQKTFNDGLINNGFCSRSWFIFEYTNRFNTLRIPDLDVEQIEAKQHLLNHIEKLTKLYGQAPMSSEAMDFLEHWWTKVHPFTRPNTSPKLDSYYARKNMHVQKLALALHFGEDAEADEDGRPKNSIQKSTCELALSRLDEAERKMHYAINFDSRNPLSLIARKINNYINRFGAQSTQELFVEFFDDIRNQGELTETINYLMASQQIHLTEIENKRTGKKEKKWEVVRRSSTPSQNGSL